MVYDLFDVSRYSDDYSVSSRYRPVYSHYNIWFQGYITEIYKRLMTVGIKTRRLFLTKEEHQCYRVLSEEKPKAIEEFIWKEI